MIGARAHGHQHGEAFMLMKYASEDGTVSEVIWNSRDGVTPFSIVARDGETSMTHVDWQNDIYIPDHQPQLGDRIFVDLTEDRARAAAKRNAARFWSTYPPSKEQFKTVEELEAMLANVYVTEVGKGAPDLIVVAG